MIPSFIIHHPSSVDRSEIVKDLVAKTNGAVVEAILLPDRKAGCRKSHILVAQMAKEQYPDSHYLVFEDDCILSEDWQRCIEGMEIADLLYIGYNDVCWHSVFGTHALLIGPRTRDKILEKAEELAPHVIDKGAYDHILSRICTQEKLIVGKPPVEEKDRYAFQKKGLVSMITGNKR